MVSQLAALGAHASRQPQCHVRNRSHVHLLLPQAAQQTVKPSPDFFDVRNLAYPMLMHGPGRMQNIDSSISKQMFVVLLKGSLANAVHLKTAILYLPLIATLRSVHVGIAHHLVGQVNQYVDTLDVSYCLGW